MANALRKVIKEVSFRVIMQKEEYKELFSKAKQSYADEHYKEAVDALERISLPGLNFDDKSLILHYLALCHSHLDQFKESLTYFERAKKEEPQSALIPFNQGLTYYYFATRVDKPKLYLEMALRCFKHALSKEAANPEYWYYRGYMHSLLNKTDEAIYCYERVFSLAKRFENRELCELYEEMYVRRNLSAKQLPNNVQSK